MVIYGIYHKELCCKGLKMDKNIVVERKKQIFQMDARLKELFNEYCSKLGIIQEQILEALVYMLVVEGRIDPAMREQLMMNIAEWKKNPERFTGCGEEKGVLAPE